MPKRSSPIFLVPSNWLRLMRKEDRPDGPAGWLPEEAQDRFERRLERKERKLFEIWLHRHPELIWNGPRPDKKSTVRKGWPDFEIFGEGPKTLFMDFKSTGAKLSEEQQAIKERLEKMGHTYLVPHSAGDAIHWASKFFGI